MTKTDLIATFPKTFGLRGFPGKVFSISESASYESPFGSGKFMLYTSLDGRDFAKATPDELRGQLVELEDEPPMPDPEDWAGEDDYDRQQARLERLWRTGE
jgi:hypothetical protein